MTSMLNTSTSCSTDEAASVFSPMPFFKAIAKLVDVVIQVYRSMDKTDVGNSKKPSSEDFQQFTIDSAADAAIALRPLAGNSAYLLFALGVVGTGFLAIPVLTDSAAYAVSIALGQEPSLTGPPAKHRNVDKLSGNQSN